MTFTNINLVYLHHYKRRGMGVMTYSKMKGETIEKYASHNMNLPLIWRFTTDRIWHRIYYGKESILYSDPI